MSNKDLAVKIAQAAADIIMSGGITDAVAFWNRNMAIVERAEREGRAVTHDEQAAITDQIVDAGDPVMRVDVGD